MSTEQEYRELCRVGIEALLLVARHVDHLCKTQQEILVDTKKLLDAVTRETTDNASMRALVVANTAALKDISAQNQDMSAQIVDLKAQIAALGTGGDTSALQAQVATLTQTVTDLQAAATQAQLDIDSAASSLSVDSDASEAALAANVTPTPTAPPTTPPAAGSAGSSSSSSSSTASDGGDVTKPSPLPGTGVSAAPQPGGDATPPASPPPAPAPDAPASDPTKLGSDPTASQAPLSGA